MGHRAIHRHQPILARCPIFLPLCLLALTLLGSCSSPKEPSCRITVDVTGLASDQPLLIWGADRLYQRIDTLYAQDGHLQVSLPIDTIAEAVLLTPDGRQHPLILERDAQLHITGALPDSLTVSGSQNDSIYALLRTASLPQYADSLQRTRLYMQYITRHPDEVGTVYVLRHFLASDTIDRAQLTEALSLLTPLMRDHQLVAQLDNFHGQPDDIAPYKNLPMFGIPDTVGVVVNRFVYNNRPLLLHFWASWNPQSREQARSLRALYDEQQKVRQKEDRLAILGVSLDAQRQPWLDAIHADSLSWDHVCNFRGWDTDLVKRLHLTELPYTILVNGNGSIRAINPTPDQIRETLKLIKKEKEEDKQAERNRRVRR